MNQRIVAAPAELPGFARNTLNLADSSLGAVIVAVSDEFFAPGPRMIDPAPPVFVADLYDDNGKWMDGWETRRRRDTGHDWCIIRLAYAGIIDGVDIDTSFFTGNFPPAASLEACFSPAGDPGADTHWHILFEPIDLSGDRHHFQAVSARGPWTHLRLNLFPDGGIARLRVYGSPYCEWQSRSADEECDLLALENGGRQVAWSDAHYGEPMRLLRPGRGINMGDGWETRRRREPGNDWCILQLGHPGIISEIIVDTAHFKGNFPARCSIQAALVQDSTDKALITQSMFWKTLLPEQPLGADRVHSFRDIEALGTISHIRFNIMPDGGVSRLRLRGRISR
ncbi:allantoicase [Mangrovitalea sediminis]|uniref:allantoicase n=1 Tax=Mangrovitalea sediminis TaxID=1982043 RepID=UPI000BE54FB0|nr:allantoicase [Mangrovitalea sediminis]